MERRRLGNYGEALAAVFGQEKGLCLIDENYRCPMGEADLIFSDGDRYHFVEVKTREKISGYRPADSINRAKRDRMKKVALYYMKEKGICDCSISLDVVEIEINVIEGI